MTNFDAAFKALIGHEGGLVDNPDDPGGLTKYGVSQRSYPKEDIRNLTLAQAKAIYKRDFWDAVRGDELPYDLAFMLFDAAVNSGAAKAIEWLQAAVGAVQDGKFGPRTLAAVQMLPPAIVAARMAGHRLNAMTNMKWSTFGKGWARRIAKNLIGMTAVLAAVVISSDLRWSERTWPPVLTHGLPYPQVYTVLEQRVVDEHGNETWVEVPAR